MEQTKSPTKHNSQEQLKNEILEELRATGKKNKQRRLSWGSALVTIVLVLLTLLSVVQTVQSAAILNKIKSGQIKSSAGTSSGVPLPASLKNLPNMVGGC